MDNNTFGVLGTGEERTNEDMKLQQVFSCQRATNVVYPVGDVIGVIGSNNEQRSETDAILQKDYGCVREGYRMPEMLEPRSSYDIGMLKQFNVGCEEMYNSFGRSRVVSIQCKGCGCQGRCGCPNCPYRVRENYGAVGNPYNTSSSVRYLPLR